MLWKLFEYVTGIHFFNANSLRTIYNQNLRHAFTISVFLRFEVQVGL